jgi:uncharacterized coiled-coil protein SlyX
LRNNKRCGSDEPLAASLYMKNTDTPKTDSIDFGWGIHEDEIWPFARQLERELAASKAEVERLREVIKYAVWVLKSYNPQYAEEIETRLNPPIEPPNERAEKAEAEIERMRDAFSYLTDEIECTSKCSSHQADHCDCGRIERAYAISDSIAQNPTK